MKIACVDKKQQLPISFDTPVTQAFTTNNAPALVPPPTTSTVFTEPCTFMTPTNMNQIDVASFNKSNANSFDLRTDNASMLHRPPLTFYPSQRPCPPTSICTTNFGVMPGSNPSLAQQVFNTNLHAYTNKPLSFEKRRNIMGNEEQRNHAIARLSPCPTTESLREKIQQCNAANFPLTQSQEQRIFSLPTRGEVEEILMDALSVLQN